MSGDSPRRPSRGSHAIAAVVPPQVVSDRSILDSAIGFINDVTLSHQPHTDSKDTITWARFESAADISDPRYGEDWELDGNVAPPLLLILGYGLGVQVWAIPANGEAVEVLSWRHGVVTALRVLPTPTVSCTSTYDESGGRADDQSDAYAEKRPLIAMVDGAAGTTSGGQTQFSAVNFVSLRSGTQVKTIKFKNPVLDIQANRSSIVITLHERIAVFDARTLEDRLSITTCYPSPGINPNPVALGPRWLAYAENKLLHSKRSGGGCDGDGVASYTATVLNAAKSLGKGLRELGEQVAAGLTGTTGSAASSKSSSFDSGSGPDAKQPGIVTIMDIKNPLKDYSGTPTGSGGSHSGCDPIVAHFIAHLDAVVALEFDNSGMLLVTADRRGHDFHIFRIQPHPVGSSLAAVHHLYVLHRGDTSAKVQNIAFSLDSRWVAVSTLRGTTHVFPITPYGGPMGVRTHTSLHVVNKLSRFHRSAGLSAEGRSSSPISHSESTTFVQSLQPYHNTTLPPYPRPTVVLPLAQLRQPMALGSPPGSASLGGAAQSGKMGGGGSGSVGGGGGSSSQRQRLSSLSDDSGKPLSVCAIFAKSRSWLLEPPNATREAPHRIQRKAVDSLFVMAGHGALIQYDLDTKLASNVAKEKICDDTPIELEVEAKAQWNLGRRKDGSQEIMPPLMLDNWLVKDRNSCMLMDTSRQYDDHDDRADSWLAQVEIITHAGPHRRLWMGPQFVFKTYNTPSGSNLTHVDAEAVEIGLSKANAAASAAAAAANSSAAMSRLERSSPLNMPLSMASHGHSAVPVLIESGSYSSIEQSPKLMDRFRHEHLNSDYSVAHGDSRLKEDLADAMRESPSSAHKDTGRLPSDATSSSDNVPFYDALAEHCDDDDQPPFEAPLPSSSSGSASNRSSSVAALASALPNIFSYDTIGFETTETAYSPHAAKKSPSSIEKVVNPLGTVTTVTAGMTADLQTDMLDEVVSQLAAEECVIHENCDESLFRPVVAIFCDENVEPVLSEEELLRKQEQCKPPEVISNKLIVPVIDKAVDDEISKKQEQRKSNAAGMRKAMAAATQSPSKAKQEVEKKVPVADGKPVDAALTQQPKVIEQKKPSKKEAQKADFSEEEDVISFKRMTPQKEDKRKSSVEKLTKGDCNPKSTKKSPPPETKKKEKSPLNDGGDITKPKDIEVIKVEMLPPEIKPNQNRGGDKKKCLTPEKDVKATPNSDKAKIAESTAIRMESLNVRDLASSLIEVADEIQDESPPRIEALTKARISIDSIVTPKLSKKAKKKQNKSGSNSESEEVIEVVKEKLPEIKMKTSEDMELPSAKTSVDEFADLADSLLESKGTISDTMYISVEVKNEETSEKKEKSKKLSDEERPKVGGSEKVELSLADTKTISHRESKISKDPLDEFETSKEQNDEKTMKNTEVVKKSTEVLKKTKEVGNRATTETAKKSVGESKELPAEKIKPVEIEEKPDKKVVQRKKSLEEIQKPGKVEEHKVKQVEVSKKVFVETKKLDNDSKKSVDVEKEPSTSCISDDNKKSKEEFKPTKKFVEDSKEPLKETKKSSEEFKKPSEDCKKPIQVARRMSSEEILKLEVEVTKKSQTPMVEKSAEVAIKTTEDSLKSTEISKKPIKDVKKSSEDPKISTGESQKTLDDSKKKSLETKSSTEDLKKPDESKKTVDDAKRSKEVSNMSNKTNEEALETSKKPTSSEAKNNEKSKQAGNDLSVAAKKTTTEETKDFDKTTKLTAKPNAKQEGENKNFDQESTKDTEPKGPAKDPLKKDNQDTGAEKKTSVGAAVDTKELKNDIKLEKGSQPKSPKKSPIKLSHDLMPFTTSPKPTPPKTETEFKEATATASKVITEQPLKSKTSPQLLQLKEDSSPKKVARALNISPPLPPATSAWKNLSGAEMISKKLDFGEERTTAYPTLGKQAGGKSKVEVAEKLLPDLPSPMKSPDKKKLQEPRITPTGGLKDFPVLKPLDSLPPLPTLEPLEVLSAGTKTQRKEESLINFESPLLENPALERKITPPPRGFTEQNLIFALCGSLHYVDTEEQLSRTLESPTHSGTRCSSALGEQSAADYKSLPENDEPYMSLDQSSQETTTTNTATTNEKLTSSTNSSACEEIIIVKEKKMTKKQKRKKQQMEMERHKSHSGAGSAASGAGNTTETDMDEELRPLIGMGDSQSEALLPPEDVGADSVSLLMEDTAFADQLPPAIFTTDSESPMPATTSDDNCIILPSALTQSTSSTPIKVKTKKLEHKINLLAAIEAATSSSTSSAEESGVEAHSNSNPNSSNNNHLDLEPILIGLAAPAQQPLVSVSGGGSSIAATAAYPTIQQGGTKKKTKRRKR